MAFIEDTLCIVWHLNCIKNTCSTVLHVVYVYRYMYVIKLSLGTLIYLYIHVCITMMIFINKHVRTVYSCSTCVPHECVVHVPRYVLPGTYMYYMKFT